MSDDIGFSGQGKILIGTRTAAGNAGLLRWLGNASLCNATAEEDAEERNESFSGNRLPYRRLARARKGMLSIKFDSLSDDNLALGLLATLTTVSPGAPVVGYACPTGAKVGNLLAVPAKNISSVAVKDSTGGGAKTLVEGTNYRVNAFAGTVELLDITAGGAYVQPFKVDYTPGGYTMVGALNQPTQDLWVQFDGVNTDTGDKVVVDFFRSRFKPVKEFPLISEGYVDWEIEGTLLADATKAANSATGQLWSIYRP